MQAHAELLGTDPLYAELAASRYEIEEALALLETAVPLAAPGRARAEVWRSTPRQVRPRPGSRSSSCPDI